MVRGFKLLLKVIAKDPPSKEFDCNFAWGILNELK